MSKLTEEQVQNVIRLQDALTEAHWCDINGGDLLYIQQLNFFEDEYDFEGELEDFLRNTDIGELDLAGIEVVSADNANQWAESTCYSLIDFATGYYDLNLYKLQNVEWK